MNNLMKTNIQILFDELTTLNSLKPYLTNLINHAVSKNKIQSGDYTVADCEFDFKRFCELIEKTVLKSAIEYGPAEILEASFVFRNAICGDEFWWDVFDGLSQLEDM
jgi:hypothetical protein